MREFIQRNSLVTVPNERFYSRVSAKPLPGSIGISFFASTGGTHIGVFGHRPASSSKNFTSDCAYLNPRIILLLSRRVSVIENRILQRISYMFANQAGHQSHGTKKLKSNIYPIRPSTTKLTDSNTKAIK